MLPGISKHFSRYPVVVTLRMFFEKSAVLIQDILEPGIVRQRIHVGGMEILLPCRFEECHNIRVKRRETAFHEITGFVVGWPGHAGQVICIRF
ncbi:MAG: hypothetical protein J7M40_15065 [Planctomycetes bacterium]|nr:hypothetical protein [Planctomycetota bacterium]